MAKPGSRAEAFSGLLSMIGHGIPLWDPIGNLNRPKEQLSSGVSIGDVGFLNSRGHFETYFNVFLPPDHPAQLHCPSDLIPLDPPQSSDLSVASMFFPPGTSLVSKGIQESTLSSSPLDIQFTISAREGGILVLPDGASREDLVSINLIRDYVKNHALNWYVYMKELFGDMVVHPNGTLYVVTGTDKASSWANCVAYPQATRINRLWKSSTIIYRGARENSTHRWETDRQTAKELIHQRSRPVENVGNCSLFVRGIRIAVNINDWTQHILHYNTPETIPFSIIRTVPILGLRAKLQTIKESFPGYSQMFPWEGGTGVRVMFHPLDVILRLLLEEFPSSTVAYLGDNILSSVVDQGDVDLSSITHLLIRILETYETNVEDGVITLLPRTSHSQVNSRLRVYSSPSQPSHKTFNSGPTTLHIINLLEATSDVLQVKGCHSRSVSSNFSENS